MCDNRLLNLGRGCGRSFFAKGETIVAEGAESTTVFLLQTGWAASETTSVDGGTVLLDVLTPGDFVGGDEEELLSPYAVTALTDVSMLALERARFQSMIRDEELVRDAYTASIISASRRLRRRRMALSSRSAARRVCEVLLELWERIGLPASANEQRRRIPLSQVRFCGAVDLTPVAVNHVVQALRAARIVHWDNTGAAVMDPERLALFSQEHC